MENQSESHRSAFIALVGRPNCGKSTLMNTILGEDLAVVTPLPQTTRQNLKGIYTTADMQLVFFDTPGMHKGGHSFNASMLLQGERLLKRREADIVCYIVDCSRADYGDEEDLVAHNVQRAGIPIVIIFNKKDLCPSVDEAMASFFRRYPALQPGIHIAVSALSKEAKGAFLRAVDPLVRQGPRFFSDEDLTDADMRFFAAEYIRKHIIRNTTDEVPHAVFVEIISYHETETRHSVEADLHVESDGQKGIIIGKKGALIRKIQEDAATDLKKLAGVPVTINCHVKITPKWRDDQRFLREMGFSVK